MEHGEEGKRMLKALLEWWQTGKNNVGKAQVPNISPIPEGIYLTEGELMARKLERGDHSSQRTVEEQIQQVLKLGVDR
jgi:intein-encoded DNA endonuclease-like protein